MEKFKKKLSKYEGQIVDIMKLASKARQYGFSKNMELMSKIIGNCLLNREQSSHQDDM